MWQLPAELLAADSFVLCCWGAGRGRESIIGGDEGHLGDGREENGRRIKQQFGGMESPLLWSSTVRLCNAVRRSVVNSLLPQRSLRPQFASSAPRLRHLHSALSTKGQHL